MAIGDRLYDNVPMSKEIAIMVAKYEANIGQILAIMRRVTAYP